MTLVSDPQLLTSLERLSQILWINSKGVRDVYIRAADSTYLPPPEEGNIWEEILQVKGRVRKFNDPLVRFEDDLSGLANELMPTVSFSRGITYKDVLTYRRDPRFAEETVNEYNPQALCVTSILVTDDNMVIVGQRKSFGDWASGFELPGGFITAADVIKRNTIGTIAESKIQDDYGIDPSDLLSRPAFLYKQPPIGEVVLLNIARTSRKAEQLTKNDPRVCRACDSLFQVHSQVRAYPHSTQGIDTMLSDIPSEQWHPPSRVTAELYRANFDAIQSATR